MKHCAEKTSAGPQRRRYDPLPDRRRLLRKIALFLTLAVCCAVFQACASAKPSEQKAPEKDPFSDFPALYREEAKRFENIGDLPNALFRWKIVSSFLPEDDEARESAKRLQAQIEKEADARFSKGTHYFEKGDLHAARKEFLLVLEVDPSHQGALEYLAQKLKKDNFLTYEAVENDSLESVARKVYKDPRLQELVAHFADLKQGERIEPGAKLRLPGIDSLPKPKKRYPKTAANLDRARNFLKEKKYSEAISAAQTYLKSRPKDEEALFIIDYSTYQIGVRLFREKKYAEAETMLKKLEPGYRNVDQLLEFIRRSR